MDLLDEIAHIEASAAPHAPLAFHQQDDWTPDDLAAAFDMWCYDNERLGSIRRSHMWHAFLPNANATAKSTDHASIQVQADLHCSHEHGETCACVGATVYRIYCGTCNYWTAIYDDENPAVTDYLDHCWAGWRTLPVLDSADKLDEATYPADFMKPGAPIITRRTGIGTRAVPGRSPFGGYDYGVTDDYIL